MCAISSKSAFPKDQSTPPCIFLLPVLSWELKNWMKSSCWDTEYKMWLDVCWAILLIILTKCVVIIHLAFHVFYKIIQGKNEDILYKCRIYLSWTWCLSEEFLVWMCLLFLKKSWQRHIGMFEFFHWGDTSKKV